MGAMRPLSLSLSPSSTAADSHRGDVGRPSVYASRVHLVFGGGGEEGHACLLERG